MSRVPAAAAPPSRPTLVDYFLLLGGFALSLSLLQLGSPLRVEPTEALPEALRDLVPGLAAPMRLPEGIILLWPFFYGIQRVRGRSQGLTSAEWLWVISWIGVALLTALSLAERQGLLAASDTAARLRDERALLRREVALLRQVRAVPVPLAEFAVANSPN